MIASQVYCGELRAVVALGGGGARGLAHFGAMQAIVESGFQVDRIVGTSIGSLAGAMCATGSDLAETMESVVNYVSSTGFRAKQESLCGANPTTEPSSSSGMLAWYDRIRSYLWARHLLTRIFTRRSLLSGRVLEDVISCLVPDIDIADTVIPLSIVAVDLKSGQQVVLEKGSLRRAILASAAIPGIFPPVEWEKMLLSDFGVLESLPAQVAASYDSEFVVGVDVGPIMQPIDDCQSALHVLLRMDEIGERYFRCNSHKLVDLLIRPEVGNFQWFDFSSPEELIQSGLKAGRSAIRGWRIPLDGIGRNASRKAPR